MDVLHQWRGWIRPIVIFLYFAVICVALPFLIIEFQENKVHLNHQAWFIGGIFVLLAVPISVWGILQHFIHYTQPLLQRHIIRIIWMVPIYAGNAWLALRFYSTAVYLDTARECYEAYVIYNFMAYLLRFLWTEYPNLEEHLEEKPQVSHIIPFCCFPKWKNGRQLLSYCKHGVLQYTVLRPIMALIAFFTQIADKYQEGDMSPKSAWLYVTFVNNCSQIWAMYCLVLFYKATKEELAPIKPVPKFLCIKAVVFFSFWQSVLISMLVYLGVIRETELFSKDRIASGLQDLCICVEMFFAALAHYYSFSHKPFVDYAQGHQNWIHSFKHMFDVSDVRDDVVNHVRVVGATATQAVTRPLRKAPAATETEKSPLLRQNSGTSTDNIDIATTSGGEESDYGGLATPPVVLTSGDFYDSVDSSYSAFTGRAPREVQQSSAPMHQHSLPSSAHRSNRVLVVEAPVIEHESIVYHQQTNDSSKLTNREQTTDRQISDDSVFNHETSQERELIEFATDDEHHAQRASETDPQRLEDSVSTITMDSTASDIGQRRSLTASMNNYAQFSDRSVTSTRSNSPSRSSQVSEK